jgi:predicted signal transduction protein with EAL and GGDEF domain
VLAECTRAEVEAKRRELQERIGRIEIEVRPGKSVRLAASAGAAVFPHDGATYEALLAEADHRMYRDKAMRRGALAVPRALLPEFMLTSVYDAAAAVPASHATSGP